MAECIECKKPLRNEQMIWCRKCAETGRVPGFVQAGLRERHPELVPQTTKREPREPAEPKSRFKRKPVI